MNNQYIKIGTKEVLSVQTNNIFCIIDKDSLMIVNPLIENKKDKVLISINNSTDTFQDIIDITNCLKTEYHDSFFVVFDDIQEKHLELIQTDEKYKHVIPINNIIGKNLKEFILKNQDKQFVIHCSAGISRSAGVGLAIECLLNFNGDKYSFQTGFSKIKEHRRYAPNYFVFDTILES